MKKKSGNPQKPSIGKFIILGIFLLGIFSFFYFDLGQYFTLDSLKANKDAMQGYTQAHYGTMVVLFVVIYLIQTALSLPGATILTLAGGFLFGAWLGTLYVNVGATSGATLAFLAARYLFRDAVERRFGEALEPVQQGFASNAMHYLLTLRLVPLFPFFLVNLASGLTRIRLNTYVGATAIGILPGSFVYCNAGKQLGTINSVKDIASPGVLGAFLLLGLLALVPVVYKRWVRTSVAETGVPVK
jgi:uncharacterized membrane protein YdjX (TVP38/TMEM64 family)